ncbi:MAG: DUF4384 domain-containing protein [Janthinobacterium lividum]
MRRSMFYLGLAVYIMPVLYGQQLTPRDAFWSASDLVSVSANPAAKPVARSSRLSTPTQRPPSRATGSRPRDPQATAQMVSLNGYGERPHLVQTSLKTQQMGLRYSVLKQREDGTFAETSAGETFHEGDLLQLSIMSNEPGYLYVIQQGSSGSWSPLFPGAQSVSNRLEPGKPYQIPGTRQTFRVDNHPGTEKLFVVLSREPLDDLGGAVDRLKHSSEPASKPARVPEGGQLLEASNHIPDEIVQRLASRDLTLVTEQKVDDKNKPADSGEKAVYVVAKQESTSQAHEIVASILLNHQ